MTERYERLFGYGAPPVNYYMKDTWTDEVKALYKRLEEKDYTALAPLLKWDIEYLRDPKAILAIVLLKYSPDLPDKKARAELRKIANVIRRRPNRSRRILPHGDQLEAELKSLTVLIEEQRLLEVKKDLRAIQHRLEVAMGKPMLEAPREEIGALVSDLSEEQLLGVKNDPRTIQDGLEVTRRRPTRETPKEEIARLAFALGEVAEITRGRIKRPRSWALQALADHYGVGPKEIETAIDREIRAGRRRR